MTDEASIPQVMSGPGKQILAQVVRPLLEESKEYDRVSCYYNPRSLLYMLDELAQIWRRGGRVRLIIGFNESAKITPAMREDGDAKKSLAGAVAAAMRGATRRLAKMIEMEHQDLIPVLRELIIRRALHVRLVTPRVNLESFQKNGVWPRPELGAFHSKFAIFHSVTREGGDNLQPQSGYYRPAIARIKAGERFTATAGSLNETERGYGENVEDVVVHRSWIDGEARIATYLLDRFEALWVGAADDVVTMPFDDELTEVIEEVARHLHPTWFRWQHFAKALRQSPSYGALSFSELGLLPHQLRCFREGLSRWPIRVLLADEVGLGKTIEAGSILDYMLKHGGARKVAILTPASLRHQWQKELRDLFGIEFWVYDSSTRQCELGDVAIDAGANPLGVVERVIISWHWARLGATKTGRRFEDSAMPDLLIVDEAHHARLREEPGEDLDQTQLYMLLDYMQKLVPHVVLLTATPFQTDHSDYLGLLKLLGIPGSFSRASLDQFARWTRGQLLENYDLRVQQAKQTHEFVDVYQLESTGFPAALLAIPATSGETVYEEYVSKHGPLTRQQVLSGHPTTLLTLRNTRTALRNQGYRFPHAHLSSAGIEITDEQASWFEDLEHYVRGRLGSVEQESNAGENIARLRSLFRQRIVSSIRAARDSLANRLSLLREFAMSNDPRFLRPTLGPDFDSADNDPDDAAPELSYETGPTQLVAAQLEAAKNESYEIERLVARIETLFQRGSVVVDPKMERLRQLVIEHLDAGRKVLIFSRFTSTTEAVVETLRELIPKTGIGRFDGKVVGTLKMAGAEVQADRCARKEIEGYLKSGRIEVLVCSDAASEGLNLHAASVAINVDVPWNPSRLLQRFGRVDRLGQKATDVYLINMYYPYSIEERMYRVLEDRRVDFMAVLGEVPEILSAQQRRMLQDLSGNPSKINLTYEEIARARREYNDSQYQHLIMKNTEGGRDRSVQEALLREICRSARRKGYELEETDKQTIVLDGRRISIDPMDDDFLPLVADTWAAFQAAPGGRGRRIPIVPLRGKDGETLAFLLNSNGILFPLTTDQWGQLFSFFFSGQPIDLSGLRAFPGENLANLVEYIRVKEAWIWPNHGRIHCLTTTSSTMPSIGDLTLGDAMGFVLATGLQVPQANDVKKVAELPKLVLDGMDNKQAVAAHFKFHKRQSDYYAEASELLGLIIRHDGQYRITDEGREFCKIPADQRDSMIAKRILATPVIAALVAEVRSRPSHLVSRAEISGLVRALTRFGGSTAKRRTQTVVAWIRFVADNDNTILWDGEILTLSQVPV